MRSKGRIASWNDEKGYGFIQPHSGTARVFVHIKAFANRIRRPEVGQAVTFALTKDKQGRPCAEKVTSPGGRVQRDWKRPAVMLSMVAATTFLLIVGLAVFMEKVPPLLLYLYAGASLITFIVYAWDKSAARKGNWRTPESHLHLLALVGGWPGAMVAQQKLRHKSKKRAFRNVYWMTVMLNCIGFAWLLTPQGSATLQSWLVHVPSVY